MNPKSLCAGDTAIMLFHGFGTVSAEEQTVLKVEKDGTLVLDTSKEEAKCFRFDPKSGRCLNDVTDFECHRTLLKGLLPKGMLVARKLVNA